MGLCAFEEVVTGALKGGDEVQITGFGKFYVREQKARDGRNPQTGEKMRIPAQKVPTFSAGNYLKESVWGIRNIIRNLAFWTIRCTRATRESRTCPSYSS